MGMFENKSGLIVGVANDRSIAWWIAKKIMAEGGRCGFTHLPDKPTDDRKKNQRRVTKCLEESGNEAAFVVPLDVQNDENIAQVMATCQEKLGKIDFLLHSVAFADRADLQRDTVETSRAGFSMAMDISAYSLLALTNGAKDLFSERASVLAMTYFGGERAVPGYNVMGICKAALDSAVKYLAFDMGPKGVRVNAVSAGPLKTLAASAVGGNEMQDLYIAMSPMGRNVTHEEVGNSGAFLLSDMSDGITGEILHVDGGYNIMGSPGRMLEPLKEAQKIVAAKGQ